MKTPKGWRKISNQRGFLNETTGQTLIIAEAEFGLHYHVLLFEGQPKGDREGKKISPEYPTEAKAEKFAMDWMMNHVSG